MHAGVSQGYVLGPGDVISITDIAEDRPTPQMCPILPDGTVVISYTGVMQAAGMSLKEINEVVNNKALAWYKNPQIIVNLAKQTPHQCVLTRRACASRTIYVW